MASKLGSRRPVERKKAAGAPEDQGELSGWTVPELDYPTFRVTLIAKVMDRLTLRYMNEGKEMNLAEWRVLARLATSPGATVGQIADLAWVDRSEVSRAAAALEQRGLTTRHPNPQDARTPLLYCTKSGMRLYKVKLRQRQAFHEQLISDLDADERRQLDTLLAKIAHRLDEMNRG